MQQNTYFSFRQRSDWNNGELTNLVVQDEGLHIQSEQRFRHSERLSFQTIESSENWLDSAESSEGWFWLDNQNHIYRFDQKLSQRELILILELDDYEYAFRLAVHSELVYVLTRSSNDEGRSALYCFYLSSGQLRWKQEQWHSSNFRGLSLAVTEHEQVVVYAKLDSSEQLSLLLFDRLGYAMEEQRIDEALEDSRITELTKEWNRHFRIVAHNHTIYSLSANQATMRLFSTLQHTISTLDLKQHIASCSAYNVDRNGLIWLIDKHSEEQESELICLDSHGEIVQQGKLMVEASHYIKLSSKAIIVCDIKQQTAYILKPRQLPLFSSELGGYSGVWVSQPLDSDEIGTVWHRFAIHTETSHDTSIRVKYFASDMKDVRVSELNTLWDTASDNSEDALFNHAIGRYLWVAIELIGTDTHSPIVTSLNVYFPRHSYINDLPVIYQRTGQDFLSNYLSLFQTMLEDTDLQIERATTKLAPHQLEKSSLRWLLSWLGLSPDDYWTDDQLRELLKEAPTLLSLRGTRYAIDRLVHIYTGNKPLILEYEDIKPLKENIELGEVVDKLYAADEHTFNVLVKADDVSSELKKLTLQHILDRYKPVFSTCKLIILQPWVYMDLHSYLGMNTFLTAPQQLMLNGKMSMPHHTITLDDSQHNQLDKHARIGLNSKLE